MVNNRQFTCDDVIHNEYNDNNAAECLQGKVRKFVVAPFTVEILALTWESAHPLYARIG